MKLTGEIIKQEQVGTDEIRITVSDIKRVHAAGWRDCGPEASFDIPKSAAKRFEIGRVIFISLTP